MCGALGAARTRERNTPAPLERTHGRKALWGFVFSGIHTSQENNLENYKSNSSREGGAVRGAEVGQKSDMCPKQQEKHEHEQKSLIC